MSRISDSNVQGEMLNSQHVLSQLSSRMFCVLVLLGIVTLSFPLHAETESGKKKKKGDAYQAVVRKIKQTDCLRFDFTALTASDVFSTVDTLAGSAVLDAQKRYRVQLGADWFLSDGDSVYIFVNEEKQMTVENAKTAAIPTELILLRQLDELYTSKLLSGDSLYLLTRRESGDSFFPSQLSISCSLAETRLKWLQFTSENGDKITILFQAMRNMTACTEETFQPSYPAGTEVIRLP